MAICIYPDCGKELTGRQKKYCSQQHSDDYYREYIAPLEWRNASKIARKRAGYKCEKCGSRDRIEVHHKNKLPLTVRTWKGKKVANYNNTPLNRQENLMVLCRKCHDKEHTNEKEKTQRKLQMPLMLESEVGK